MSVTVRDKRVSRQPSVGLLPSDLIGGLTRGSTGAFLKPVLARARASRASRDASEDVEAAE